MIFSQNDHRKQWKINPSEMSFPLVAWLIFHLKHDSWRVFKDGNQGMQQSVSRREETEDANVTNVTTQDSSDLPGRSFCCSVWDGDFP